MSDGNDDSLWIDRTLSAEEKRPLISNEKWAWRLESRVLLTEVRAQVTL
jgi:hypothetical protein